jgi:hypothetical protein
MTNKEKLLGPGMARALVDLTQRKVAYMGTDE